MSVAQRTASTALGNSARMASPAVLKTRPRCVATRASKIFLWPRKVRSVCSSSSLIRRLNSATSAERMVESLRSRNGELGVPESVGTGQLREELPDIIAPTLPVGNAEKLWGKRSAAPYEHAD